MLRCRYSRTIICWDSGVRCGFACDEDAAYRIRSKDASGCFFSLALPLMPGNSYHHDSFLLSPLFITQDHDRCILQAQSVCVAAPYRHLPVSAPAGGARPHHQASQYRSEIIQYGEHLYTQTLFQVFLYRLLQELSKQDESHLNKQIPDT
jgi:hypothetical protein